MRSIVSLLFFLFIYISVFSQEVLNDLFVNPALINKTKPTPLKSTNTILGLPFFDDFSIISGYPSADLWMDNNVFINATYGINPPSIGVATFDGVDENGFLYPSLTDKPSPADVLTSQFMDLSLADPDGTFLSFYYQPQGYGNAPEFNDSLVLNVISKDSVFRIWFANGTDYESFVKDSLGIIDRPDTLEFKLVHLKLDNPSFFTDSFQIQFVNYVSIAGVSNLSGQTNADHWNVDYIYLNDGRTQSDTIFKDMAMVEPSTLFMKDYSSVPWNHFEAIINKQLTDLYFHIRNNDSETRNMSQLILTVKDIDKGTLKDYYIGQQNIAPYENKTSLLWNFSSSPINWYEAESAEFEISGEIILDRDDPKDNNFTSRNVKFENYYGYDDGTAEKAYGIDNEKARIAYRYDIARGDSLRAVQMYFVRPKSIEAAVQSFTLCIWDDYNNSPGTIILEESNKEPIYSDNLNEFITIPLDTTIYLEGTFYIGWKQTSDLLMNVGYDANTIRPNKLFYEVNSTWYESDYKGSLMMRPVFGKEQTGTSIANNQKAKRLVIGPNPSKGFVNIFDAEELSYGTVAIFNYLGSKVFEKMIGPSETIDVNHLINGMYIISFLPENGKSKSARLIISK